MKNKTNSFLRYMAQIILSIFLILVIWIFTENIGYFSRSLISTFSDPVKIAPITINLSGLNEITDKINIDKNNIALIKK